MARESFDEFDDKLVFKPCQKCGSVKYDNADCGEDEMDTTIDGKFIFHPKACDQCTFELVLSSSEWIH